MNAAVECCGCGRTLNPATVDAHWAHESDCEKAGDCRCDLYACAACCTEPCCRPAVIPGQVEAF